MIHRARSHVMARAPKFSNPQDQEIHEIHLRYIEVMEGDRLASISDETKAHYLRILKVLTEKLEIPGKPLSEVVGEMMTEAAPLLFQAMQR
jgi:hypothetical protein